MPFEPAPKQFANIAETILLGCKLPATPDGSAYYSEHGQLTHACVWTAHLVGRGATTVRDIAAMDIEDWSSMEWAYKARYGTFAVRDYVDRHFSREEIAARIAAL